MELQWPLILFTTFIAWSAGLFSVQSFYALKGEAEKAQLPSLIASLVLMVVGGIAVFFHLQHWERIFNGFGHISSGITQELICIVLVVIMMVLFFVFLRRGDKVPSWVAALSILFSVVLVCIMGHSYMMAARPTWNSFVQILSLIGAAAALGVGTFAMIDALKSEKPAAENGLYAIIGTAVNALTTVVFAVAMAGATSQFRDFGFQFDPTHPNKGLVEASQYTAFGGDAMAPMMAAIIFAVLPILFAFLGKKDGKWKVWGAAIAASAVISAICLRVVFYITGGSIYMY